MIGTGDVELVGGSEARRLWSAICLDWKRRCGAMRERDLSFTNHRLGRSSVGEPAVVKLAAFRSASRRRASQLSVTTPVPEAKEENFRKWTRDCTSAYK